MMPSTRRWAVMMMLYADDPDDDTNFFNLYKRPAPEYQEDYDKYIQEIRNTGGFGVTSPYGHRLAKGICCVPNANLSDPTLLDIIGFAFEDRNKSHPNDEHLCLESIVRVNYQILLNRVLHYITVNVYEMKDHERKAFPYCVLVATCFEGCKSSGGFCFLPRRPNKEFFKVEAAGEEFAVRALDELKKYKGLAFEKRLSEILAIKEMRKKKLIKNYIKWDKEMIMQRREIEKAIKARHRLKVTLTDSPNDSDHPKVYRLNTTQDQDIAKDANIYTRKYCEHTRNPASTQFCPASYMSSTLLPQPESVGTTDVKGKLSLLSMA